MNAPCTPFSPDLDPRPSTLDLSGERVAQRRSLCALVVPRAEARDLREQFHICSGERAQLGDDRARIGREKIPRDRRAESDIDRGTGVQAARRHPRTVRQAPDIQSRRSFRPGPALTATIGA